MKALFLGGDRRTIEVINYLYSNNFEITAVGYDSGIFDEIVNYSKIDELVMGDFDLIFFPINGVNMDLSINCDYSNNPVYLKDDILKDVKKKTLIFTGIKSKKLEEILEIGNKKAITIMDDPQVKKDNSIPTVEGIIGDLVYNTESTICNSNIFVLGYGNIGLRLVDSLISLDANVTVGVIRNEDYYILSKKMIPCIYTNNQQSMDEVIHNSEIIINTVPSLIINSDYLNLVNKDTYILDISSYPYGVDFNYAGKLNIKYKLLPGIPGKVAPKTAGKILTKKINSILKGENI